MFQAFYHLREQPFGTNPDPRFLYLSKAHREAFSSLLYRIQADSGFLAMVAEPGMGKTTLLFHLLRRLQPTAKTAFIFQTQCAPNELLRHLLFEFECDTSITDPVQMSQQLKSLLLAEANADRRCILIIDEAQNLEHETLETIRLLSNFETPRRKLLQIILAGQSELGEIFARPDTQQLRQRLSCIVHIQRFTPEETALYIAHRLTVAGYTGHISELFNYQALARIAQLSEGIPRVINNICFNALSLGFALESNQIGLGIVDEVASDLGLSVESRSAQAWPVTFRTASLGNSSREVRPRDEEGDALSAITAAYKEHEQTQAKVVKMKARTARARKRGAQAELPSPAELPEDQTVERPSTVTEPSVLSPATSNGFAPTDSRLGAESDVKAAVSSPAVAVPPIMMAHFKINDPAKGSNGLHLVRGCACALALCVTPAIDRPIHQNIADQYAVGSVKGDLLTTTNPPQLISDGPSPAPQYRGARTSSAHSSFTVSGRSRSYATKSNRQTANFLENEKLKSNQITSSTVNPAPFNSVQMLAPVPLSSIRMAAHENRPATPAPIPPRFLPSQPVQFKRLVPVASYVPPQAILQPAPKYPGVARSVKATGDVLLLLSISNRGNVYKISVLKGNALLVTAAENAVRKWKYLPAVSNGQPVDSQVTVTFQFRMN